MEQFEEKVAYTLKYQALGRRVGHNDAMAGLFQEKRQHFPHCTALHCTVCNDQCWTDGEVLGGINVLGGIKQLQKPEEGFNEGVAKRSYI